MYTLGIREPYQRKFHSHLVQAALRQRVREDHKDILRVQVVQSS